MATWFCGPPHRFTPARRTAGGSRTRGAAKQGILHPAGPAGRGRVPAAGHHHGDRHVRLALAQRRIRTGHALRPGRRADRLPLRVGAGYAAGRLVCAQHGRHHQVLIRQGEALERLAGVRTVLLDKTGTLTTDEPRVAEFVAAEPTRRAEILLTAIRLAEASRPPSAKRSASSARPRRHREAV